MKKKIIVISSLIAILICIIMSYRMGWKKGHQDTQILSFVSFIQSLSFLEHLETNNVAEATSEIQSFCYANATSMLSSKHWRNDKVVGCFFSKAHGIPKQKCYKSFGMDSYGANI